MSDNGVGDGSWVLMLPTSHTSIRRGSPPIDEAPGTRTTKPETPSIQESAVDRLMAETYPCYVPPEAMSGEFKVLPSLERVCSYCLELFESHLMEAKRSAMVVQELARLKSGDKDRVSVQASTVLQYDDTDLLTYMSGHMQRAVVLEPLPAGSLTTHGYSWLCEQMRMYLRKMVTSGV